MTKITLKDNTNNIDSRSISNNSSINMEESEISSDSSVKSFIEKFEGNKISNNIDQNKKTEIFYNINIKKLVKNFEKMSEKKPKKVTILDQSFEELAKEVEERNKKIERERKQKKYQEIIENKQTKKTVEEKNFQEAEKKISVEHDFINIIGEEIMKSEATAINLTQKENQIETEESDVIVKIENPKKNKEIEKVKDKKIKEVQEAEMENELQSSTTIAPSDEYNSDASFSEIIRGYRKEKNCIEKTSPASGKFWELVLKNYCQVNDEMDVYNEYMSSSDASIELVIKRGGASDRGYRSLEDISRYKNFFGQSKKDFRCINNLTQHEKAMITDFATYRLDRDTGRTLGYELKYKCSNLFGNKSFMKVSQKNVVKEKVYDLINFLKKNNDELGIFRISANKAIYDEIARKINAEEHIDFKKYKQTELACGLKCYIREYLCGFFDERVGAAIDRAFTTQSVNSCYYVAKLFGYSVDWNKRELMVEIFNLFHEISKNESVNKMTIKNLIASSGPSFFPKPKKFSMFTFKHYITALHSVYNSIQLEHIPIQLFEEAKTYWEEKFCVTSSGHIAKRKRITFCGSNHKGYTTDMFGNIVT